MFQIRTNVSKIQKFGIRQAKNPYKLAYVKK